MKKNRMRYCAIHKNLINSVTTVMDIFAANCLYPPETEPVLQHFSPHFDAVYVALIPFFQLSNREVFGRSKTAKKIISLEEAQQQDPIFKRLDPTVKRFIYTADENYPTDEEIGHHGEPITWKQVLDKTNIIDYKTLHKALLTSIGALRSELQTPEALQTLKECTESEGIFHPTEGAFDVFTKKQIYKLLKKLVKCPVVVTDEFYEETKQLDIAALDKASFLNQIRYNDYYIYPQDKAFLFTISWDYFFFFIAIDRQKIKPGDIEANFEGFWATEQDSHLWYW